MEGVREGQTPSKRGRQAWHSILECSYFLGITPRLENSPNWDSYFNVFVQLKVLTKSFEEKYEDQPVRRKWQHCLVILLLVGMETFYIGTAFRGRMKESPRLMNIFLNEILKLMSHFTAILHFFPRHGQYNSCANIRLMWKFLFWSEINVWRGHFISNAA